ncbi:MAG TPA: cupin domain-containing protein [Candidatus Ornithocaccomicrobium faecavium]|jgi:transcriptional regulator with XRE-family HTH domain|uniref:Cupin domain-containing protein n=2 Tax=Clostridia incertae sedis TaxID=189325 RepID=A0A9D1K7G4_9FIRM|nr:cupin domain-containing protein [Clostridiales bacterium]HIS92878.1 cupin domain-containing protein [Candidatus Alectryocaccomicrobium excrementavium]HIV28902.1 cupin domain-containing protein [Candidatus Ornithocaccomicrobium faecavium]
MSDPIQTVAMRICDLRDIAGLSQEQVAERAGVPLEEYIAYEAGTRDFSFSHLFNIAGVLGVDISDLLTGESPKLKGYILTRAGKGLAFERRKAYQYEHLAYNFRDKKAEPFMVTVDYDPSGKEKPAHSHEGQEFDYVLEGHMKIVLGGNDVYLGPGDSIYYDSAIPHAMYAVDSDCHFIAVVIK